MVAQSSPLRAHKISSASEVYDIACPLSAFLNRMAGQKLP